MSERFDQLAQKSERRRGRCGSQNTGGRKGNNVKPVNYRPLIAPLPGTRGWFLLGILSSPLLWSLYLLPATHGLLLTVGGDVRGVRRPRWAQGAIAPAAPALPPRDIDRVNRGRGGRQQGDEVLASGAERQEGVNEGIPGVGGELSVDRLGVVHAGAVLLPLFLLVPGPVARRRQQRVRQPEQDQGPHRWLRLPAGELG